MSATKLKVCGMKRKDNILEVGRYDPDFMGFIFYDKSPRYVGEGFEIPAELSPDVKRVGVFVNEMQQEILTLSQRHRLDLVQLHGDETADQCRLMKEKGLGVIKVFAVDENFDFDILKAYESFVDYFLFDYKGKLRGGNGQAFDWSLLSKYKRNVPFFLSGGINTENVSQVNDLNHPKLFAVDVNSGIEKAPGIKDIGKMEQLVTRLKVQ